MMNKVESIKVVIMKAFELYKPMIDLNDKDLSIIDKMDNCITIEELNQCINCEEFREIKSILKSKEFTDIIKKSKYNDEQIAFVENLK